MSCPARLLPPPVLLLLLAACAGGGGAGPAGDLRPTGADITAEDLSRRVHVLADDSLGGRRTGTEGARKAAAYIADELRRLGLEPAGGDGTYFQDIGFEGADADRPAAAPARNVVAVLRGRDPALAGQYVAIGAHSDHLGVARRVVDHDSVRAYNRVMRPWGAESPRGTPTAEQAARIRALLDSLRAVRPGPRPDSIANGADDDASGTAAVLEIAQALASLADDARPRRSVLLVWHTGEELGLLGARWFTEHPTVPRDSIVAMLNLDLVGRSDARVLAAGTPARYVQLIGSRRRSTALGDLIEAVNREAGHDLYLDYQFDAPGHPVQYWCRSDHFMYARHGIPVTFFSTGGHQDYHQVTDEAQYLDYPHMTRVVRFVRDVALRLANGDVRPAPDVPAPDPDARCVQ